MPETDNIINLPTPMNVLADRIRAAYGRTEQGRHEWIEGTLELAAALAEARTRFKADRQFAVWLAENDLDQLGENDRAALIKMAQEPTLLRDILTEQADQLHPDTILRKSIDRFGNIPKPDLPSPNPEKTSLIPEPETKPAAETTPRAAQTKPVSKQSPLFGLPRAEEVAACFTSIDARGRIGKAIRVRGAQCREYFRAKLHIKRWPRTACHQLG